MGSIGLVVFYIAIFSGGLIFDYFGLWAIRSIYSFSLAVGALALAFCKEYESLLWVVVVAWGFQAAMALLSSFPICKLQSIWEIQS
jgi:hypothetical protein